MFACAGLSTEVSREKVLGLNLQVLPLVSPECSGSRERFLNIRRPGPDGSQPGRIGFMSTQRRDESRRRRTRCISSAVLPAWFHNGHADSWPEGMERRFERVSASGFPYRRSSSGKFVWPAREETRRGLPPLWAGSRTANFRSLNPAFPAPAVFLRLQLSAPLIPASLFCRAERYDGKRDLYFQHAARNAACNS